MPYFTYFYTLLLCRSSAFITDASRNSLSIGRIIFDLPKKRPQVMPCGSYILRCLTATFPTKIFVDPHTIATSVTLFPSSRIASTRMVTIPQRHNIAFRKRHRETAKQEQSSQHKYHKFFHDSVPFLLHLDLSCVFVGKVQKIPRLKASPPISFHGLVCAFLPPACRAGTESVQTETKVKTEFI